MRHRHAVNYEDHHKPEICSAMELRAFWSGLLGEELQFRQGRRLGAIYDLPRNKFTK